MSPTESGATTALETLKSEVAHGTEAFDVLGGVLYVEDTSASQLVPVTAPLDRNGDPILEWFTRKGYQVDFDDFSFLLITLALSKDSLVMMRGLISWLTDA